MIASRAPKRRKTERSSGDEASVVSSKNFQQAFYKNATNWDLEQDYEQRKRKDKKKGKESNRLPIKTTDGRVEHVHVKAGDNVSVNYDDDSDSLDSENEDGDGSLVSSTSTPPREEPELPERQQILQTKEELAKLGLALNENAEENVGAFKRLTEIAKSPLESVKKLALATQMVIYKDVIPGYRIRPLEEGGPPGERVSKEVRRLRGYEQALVAGYQGYVRELSRLAKTTPVSGDGSKQHVSSVAVACACTLLEAVPHFNFRGELVKIIVGRLSRRRVDDDFMRCLVTLQKLFRDDEEGRPSMEVVSQLSRMARSRDYKVDESVINLFLHLRLLSEFSGKGSQDHVDNPTATAGGPSKKQRRFLTKKERKERKEKKALEREMVQADAQVVHEERDRMQSEMLKLVFATYFRILKARVPHLMGVVLEGLAKYAHLINQDFFGDLLEALKDLIRHSDESAGTANESDEEAGEDGLKANVVDGPVRNLTRESLLCTVTAFALLAGQDAHNSRHALHLDLAFFTTHLFATLLPLCTRPDLEVTASTLALRATLNSDDSSAAVAAVAPARVNAHTVTVLLLRALTSVLLPPWNIRSVPPLRLAAFSKQLMTASLHLPEKSCRAALVLLGDVLREHGRKVTFLWHTEERRGDGRWEPTSESVEGTNPRTATIWEGEILRKHYAPEVRDDLLLLEKLASGG